MRREGGRWWEEEGEREEGRSEEGKEVGGGHATGEEELTLHIFCFFEKIDLPNGFVDMRVVFDRNLFHRSFLHVFK